MMLLKKPALALLALLLCLPAAAADDAHWKKATASIDQGIAYLRTQQNEDGSWMPDVGPAITGLALTALLNQPDIGPSDPAAEKAIAYILKHAQEDGSIRNGPDGILASYNTAITLTALARVGNSAEVAEVIRKGQDFLRGTQWIKGMTDPQGNIIDENHPYYGGFGYGNKGRPDISNTQFALQALHDTGVDCEDPVFKRALSFLNNLQATDQNKMFGDKMAELDGGFIYSPTINKDNIGAPESKASQDQIDEAKAGRPVSGLRTYGSVTYAGFKTLVYANLDRDDKRVVAALDWISKNYVLDRNPGMPEKQKLQGLFYYYLAMGRAMNAYGSSTIAVAGGETAATITAAPDAKHTDLVAEMEALKAKGITDIDLALGEPGTGLVVTERPTTVQRNWSNDLIAMVVSLQHKDGYWANTENRWMESHPVLVTAYSIIALQEAID